MSATRVLMVSWEYPPIVAGGLARHVCKLSEQLVRDGVEVHVLTRGAVAQEPELRAQARKLGLMDRGTFIGWTGDELLHSLYRIADLCMVPSIYEPFGLVALEAMASGCPCVVADTGGLREVVPAGRKVGLRFRASDSASLARMSRKLLGDDALRDRLVAQAREHVLQFEWGDVARRTESLYADLVGARV